MAVRKMWVGAGGQAVVERRQKWGEKLGNCCPVLQLVLTPIEKGVRESLHYYFECECTMRFTFGISSLSSLNLTSRKLLFC